ncbi:MAG TPA: DUF971 domain-containing protein [Burkholderiaceae bacterium]|jgi:DUF971 family protein|nr:DUF971 domain-containing protein [Burkholderiaceae bacterium]
MAGLDKSSALPTRIVVHQQSRVLEIEFNDGKVFRLSFEFLRVNSPSAEVRGHGPGQEVLQTGKRDVGITRLEQVGHYAVQPFFSDGHSTGLFSWDYLHWIGMNEATLWREYLARLSKAGASREPPEGDAAPPGAGPETGAGAKPPSASPPAEPGMQASEARRSKP